MNLSKIYTGKQIEILKNHTHAGYGPRLFFRRGIPPVTHKEPAVNLDAAPVDRFQIDEAS